MQLQGQIAGDRRGHFHVEALVCAAAPGPPQGPLIFDEPLWSLIVGILGTLEGSWWFK